MISDERIMGFVEGEGCFAIAIEKYTDNRPRKTSRKNNIKNPMIFMVRPSFRITLSEKDKKMLELIQERFGSGKIYKRKPHKNHLPGCQYYVQTFADVLNVRDFFQNQTFITEKGKDFQLWAQCLKMMENKGHLTPKGLLEICKIRDGMNPSGNKSCKNRNYEKIVEMLKEEIAKRKQNQTQLIHNSKVVISGAPQNNTLGIG